MTDQEDLEKVTARVRKLLALSEKNPNEAEAASAAAKAQELLVAYNLDMATVEQGGNSGKREEARQRGGMYLYERQLWTAVAELNFCLYFPSRKWMIRRPEKRVDGFLVRAEKKFLGFQHRVIGRTVNTAATRAMGEYLQQTVERLCRERLHGDHGDKVHTQFFSSWAIAYREGIVDRVVEKLRERRQHLVKEEQRKAHAAEKAARAAGRKDASTATALTISSVTQSEFDANADFMMGEGWSAKRAAERAAQAAAEEEADRAYAQWAKENPEEAKKKAAQEAAEARKYWSRRQGGRRGGWGRESAKDRRAGSGAYYAGYDTGAGVSIEPQVDRGTQKRLGS